MAGFPQIRFRDESGIALPVALAVLLTVFVLALAAVASGMTATHQSLRDRSAKRAFQAAVRHAADERVQRDLITRPDAYGFAKLPNCSVQIALHLQHAAQVEVRREVVGVSLDTLPH